jgi:ATP-dependent RNA helicase DDX5/DBP2
VLEILSENPKFKAPTPIQSQAWPIALQGRDMIGIAQTGSGKTLSFVLPAIVHATAAMEQGREGPTVLVMTPTRELAMQIEDETAKFAEAAGLTSLAVFGGMGRKRQGEKLKEGADILIATPGRLFDFVDMGELKLEQISFLVLDEADRMLDMGFEPAIRRICDTAANSARQTMMFSASWPEEVQELAKEFCQMAPVFVQIGREADEDGTTVNRDITQVVKVMDSGDKYNALCELLVEQTKNGTEPKKLLIFCQMKRTVDELEAQLGDDNEIAQKVKFSSSGIHGDKEQLDRYKTLKRFKDPLDEELSRIMIATDVASRGLDVRDIDIVVNYDMPNNIEDYVHRIGRTGRAGDKGLAIGFLTPDDRSVTRGLFKVLERCQQEVPAELNDIVDHEARRRPRKKKREDNDDNFGGGGDDFEGGCSFGRPATKRFDVDANMDSTSKMASRRAAKAGSKHNIWSSRL